MTAKGFGMTTVIDQKGRLLGVFTDGDLRRVIDSKIDLSSAYYKRCYVTQTRKPSIKIS